jgi:hypothetical protein
MEKTMSKIKMMLRAKLRLLLVLSVLLTLAVLPVVVNKTFDLNAAGKSAKTEGQKPHRAFNPERQKSVSAESETIAVSLDHSEPCQDCPGGTAFVVSIKDTAKGTVTTATIRDQTAQVDEIFVASPTRIVVLGSANGTMRTVNILNSDTGDVVDHFLCTYPSLSKNGRFLAFVRSAPRFSAPQEWSYTYLIYDLAKDPAQSRGDAEEIGVQVYPSATARRNEKAIDESSAHVLASEALFWLEDNLVFVDRANRSNTLVIVDPRAETDRAKVKTKALETAKLVKKCGESDDAPENLINVTGITFKEGSKKVAHLNFQPMGKCLQSTTLDVSIE